MNEIQQLHQKLDQVLNELASLKAGLKTSPCDELLSLPEAAKVLSLSTSRVYALIYEGKLKPLQRRKFARIQFSKQTIQQYLYGNTNNNEDNSSADRKPIFQ